MGSEEGGVEVLSLHLSTVMCVNALQKIIEALAVKELIMHGGAAVLRHPSNEHREALPAMKMEDPIFNHFIRASFYAAARAGKRILLEEPVFSETW